MEQLLIWTELLLPEFWMVLACGLVAGLCRGFSGFGLSALIVTSLTLILLPSEVVPIALLLEMISSLVMARMTWSAIHWPLLRWLLIGAALGVPIGVLILKFIAPDPLRIAISLSVLAASLLLFFGRSLVLRETGGRNFSVGLLSGLANGAASIGGLPVAIYMMAVALPAEAVRATLNLYFLILDAYGTGALIFAGLLDLVTLARTAVLVLPVLLGIWLGNKVFKRSSALHYRYFVLCLLMVLALLGLAKSLL
ncbi:sulfite exporter TauE/SafE family protein [Kiloniella laminariae]|uniref:sulfite exporter TauE/SafE family protein n=1 Tax=Kiloniella laminariae TaxID=454162 RepID=UPI000378F019|nr:sulfite exporter TauE/SafE family protein [Kiloniella laminariae]